MTENAAAIDAAMAVLDAHMTALNARDASGLAATLHFPHYRLSNGRMQIWATPDTYFADFLARTNEGWDHSAWDSREVIAADPDKVHLDVRFTRYGGDGAALGRYRSLWIVAALDGVWAAQARSSFAS